MLCFKTAGYSQDRREIYKLVSNEYDDDHILKICKIAAVDDFIGSHPKGYDLEIRERGIGLSGGQKQAINLARSLLHDPKILLLDEPTSSMDQGTEKKVVEALEASSADKTMLVVTHRNPILKMVDRVFVIETNCWDQTPEELGIKKGLIIMSDVEFKRLKEMAGSQRNSSSVLLLP